MVEELGIGLGQLAGLAAIVTVVVNILKEYGVVKPGDSLRAVAAGNLIVFVLALVLRLYVPQVSVAVVDSVAGRAAEVGMYALGLAVQMGSSKATYSAVKGLPVVGKSFSEEKTDAAG